MRPGPMAMAGPIGFGVARALREARARRRHRIPVPPSPLVSWMYFVALTALLSWMTVALHPPPTADAGAGAARLLDAALWYAAAMGWQPLAAAWVVHWVRGGDTDAAVRSAPLADISADHPRRGLPLAGAGPSSVSPPSPSCGGAAASSSGPERLQ